MRYLNRSPVSVDTSFSLRVLENHNKDLGDDIFPILENQLGIQLGSTVLFRARAADHSNGHLKGEIDLIVGDALPMMWMIS